MNIQKIKEELDMCTTQSEYDKILSKYDLCENEVPSDYLYCIHCERAFKNDGNDMLCHYEDCNGGVGDLWNWDSVRLTGKYREEEYPKIPEIGKQYPLYGDRSDEQ